MKRCIWCGRTLPDDEFYRDDRYADGLMSGCKHCRCELSRSQYRESQRPRTAPRQHGKAVTPRERWEAMFL